MDNLKKEYTLNTEEYKIFQLLKENKELMQQMEELKERISTKQIKRDDVINRMKEIGDHNRNNWIHLILREFGEDFATQVYQDGYQQGMFDHKMAVLKEKNYAENSKGS